MTTVARMTDGRIVEVVRVAQRVAFSDVVGWVCVCFDFGVCERRKTQFKWVPADTRFDWVREFVS